MTGKEITPGIFYQRTLGDEEKSTLLESYEAVKDEIPREDEVCWLNIYLNKKQTFPDEEFSDGLWEFVNELISEMFKDLDFAFKEKHILAYGFITNPAGSKKIQHFHCDYTLTTSNLFIPLTKITLKNSTQFISTKLHHAKMDKWDNFGATPEDVMESEGVDCLMVSQLVSKPWTILRMNPGSPHRGIQNGDDYDRVMFFVTIDNYYHELVENAKFKEILDEDEFLKETGFDINVTSSSEVSMSDVESMPETPTND